MGHIHFRATNLEAPLNVKTIAAKILGSWGYSLGETQSECELDSGSESKQRRDWSKVSEKDEANCVSITMDDLVYEKWA